MERSGEVIRSNVQARIDFFESMGGVDGRISKQKTEIKANEEQQPGGKAAEKEAIDRPVGTIGEMGDKTKQTAAGVQSASEPSLEELADVFAQLNGTEAVMQLVTPQPKLEAQMRKFDKAVDPQTLAQAQGLIAKAKPGITYQESVNLRAEIKEFILQNKAIVGTEAGKQLSEIRIGLEEANRVSDEKVVKDSVDQLKSRMQEIISGEGPNQREEMNDLLAYAKNDLGPYFERELSTKPSLKEFEGVTKELQRFADEGKKIANARNSIKMKFFQGKEITIQDSLIQVSGKHVFPSELKEFQALAKDLRRHTAFQKIDFESLSLPGKEIKGTSLEQILASANGKELAGALKELQSHPNRNEIAKGMQTKLGKEFGQRALLIRTASEQAALLQNPIDKSSLPKAMANAIPSFTLEERKQEELNSALSEVLTTEISYQTDLEIFERALDNLQANKVITKQERELLSLADAIKGSKLIEANLRSMEFRDIDLRRKAGDNWEKNLDIFVKGFAGSQEEVAALSKQQKAKFQAADALRKKLSGRDGFSEAFEKSTKGAREAMGLPEYRLQEPGGYTILPIQRPPRHKLFLQGLDKNFSPSNPDLAFLIEVQKQINDEFDKI